MPLPTDVASQSLDMPRQTKQYDMQFRWKSAELKAIVAHPSRRILTTACLAIGLSGCVSVANQPLNDLALSATNAVPTLPETSEGDGATMVGLAFSGGGTRAAAYSFGLLRELEKTPLPDDSHGRTMIDAVRIVSGVSGGSVTAAYFGLKGKKGYGDFREKFLIRDAESNMRTKLGPANLIRAWRGGINDQGTFGGWLDQNLFNGARYSELTRPNGPRIWINASDIYNRTPFIFGEETFAALCSSLGDLPIAEAVAASAAVPVVFSPIVLKSFGTQCDYRPPGWLQTAIHNPEASTALQAFATALESYQDVNRLKFVKLVDGGITDNHGVTALALARAASQTPYGPFTKREAVRIKRLIYLVADAGTTPDAPWGSTAKGPGMTDLISAVTDTAIKNSVREGYDSFRFEMGRWQSDLVEFRCSLSRTEVRRLRGTLTDWNCRDVKFFVSRIGFDDVEPVLRSRLQLIETRLKLPVADVDDAIAGGRQALRNDPIFQGALKSMRGIDTDNKQRMTPSLETTPVAPTPMSATN